MIALSVLKAVGGVWLLGAVVLFFAAEARSYAVLWAFILLWPVWAFRAIWRGAKELWRE